MSCRSSAEARSRLHSSMETVKYPVSQPVVTPAPSFVWHAALFSSPLSLHSPGSLWEMCPVHFVMRLWFTLVRGGVRCQRSEVWNTHLVTPSFWICGSKKRKIVMYVIPLHVFLSVYLCLTSWTKSIMVGDDFIGRGIRTGWWLVLCTLLMIICYYNNDAGYFDTLFFTETLFGFHTENCQSQFFAFLTYTCPETWELVAFVENAACIGTGLCPCSLWLSLLVRPSVFLSISIPLFSISLILSFHSTGF